MALNCITLVLDLADGTGTPLATGQALLDPSAQLTDATDDMIVTKARLSAKLAGSYPQVQPLATGNTALRLQDGRGRHLSPGRRETHSRSRSPSRPALTLSPRPASARPCSLPSATPVPTASRSCSPGRRSPAGSLASRRLSPGRRRGRKVRAGHALHQSFLRAERGLRGQHRPGRHARHQPRRGTDHRLRPVRRLRRHDALPVRNATLPRHDRRPGLAAARLAAQVRQSRLFLTLAPASPPVGPPWLSQTSPAHG